jgi:hypothetical protein
MDEVYPAKSVMYEDVLGRSLMQPLHGFPEGMLQRNAFFYVFSRV